MAVAARNLALLGLLALTVPVAASFTCPSYASIRQPSVAEGKFEPAEMQGIWYIEATNEPTMPGFCKCGVNDYSVHASWYSYTNTDYCPPVEIRFCRTLGSTFSDRNALQLHSYGLWILIPAECSALS